MALCKKKTAELRLWRAFDPVGTRTLGWILCKRDDATCRKLLDRVGTKGKVFVTDDRAGFHRLIPEEQLHAGKDLAFPIEQDHGNIRHYIARFRRRTKVVPKCAEMVAATLKLYRHDRDRPENLENLAQKMRTIFS